MESRLSKSGIVLMCDTGCGKFFEGDAKQMNTALNHVLAKLPDDTKVFVCLWSTREE